MTHSVYPFVAARRMLSAATRLLLLGMLSAAAMLLLLFGYGDAPVSAKQGAAQKVQGVKIRVNATEVTGAVDQLLRITIPKGTIGVHIASAKGTADFQVTIMRAPAGAEPKTLTKKDFKAVETFALKAGATASRNLSEAVDVGISIPTGLLVDAAVGGVQDCTCCVTCPDGTTICGCSFGSSCGNCPH